jgi:hypothetical protein
MSTTGVWTSKNWTAPEQGFGMNSSPQLDLIWHNSILDYICSAVLTRRPLHGMYVTNIPQNSESANLSSFQKMSALDDHTVPLWDLRMGRFVKKIWGWCIVCFLLNFRIDNGGRLRRCNGTPYGECDRRRHRQHTSQCAAARLLWRI